MILLDTSIWVDHLRSGDARVAELLTLGRIMAHPFVIGELALGHLRERAMILTALSDLPQARPASDAETLFFIERHGLAGRGISYVDAHLLAATRLTAGCSFWTHDRRLAALAEEMGLAAVSG